MVQQTQNHVIPIQFPQSRLILVAATALFLSICGGGFNFNCKLRNGGNGELAPYEGSHQQKQTALRDTVPSG